MSRAPAPPRPAPFPPPTGDAGRARFFDDGDSAIRARHAEAHARILRHERWVTIGVVLAAIVSLTLWCCLAALAWVLLDPRHPWR